MGKIFLEHMGGKKLYNCARCRANLTNNTQLMSKGYSTEEGQAYLFDKVVNVTFGGDIVHQGALIYRQQMREVFCKNCKTKLGLIYVYVKDENSRFLEGRILLEKAMIIREKGLDKEI